MPKRLFSFLGLSSLKNNSTIKETKSHISQKHLSVYPDASMSKQFYAKIESIFSKIAAEFPFINQEAKITRQHLVPAQLIFHHNQGLIILQEIKGKTASSRPICISYFCVQDLGHMIILVVADYMDQ